MQHITSNRAKPYESLRNTTRQFLFEKKRHKKEAQYYLTFKLNTRTPLYLLNLLTLFFITNLNKIYTVKKFRLTTFPRQF